MERKTKKTLAVIAAAVMCTASVSVSAAEWRLSGYETSNEGLGPFYQQSALIYQEFDGNGFATGRTVSGWEAQEEGLKGYGKVEFKNPWVDITYPNKEYAQMYVDNDYSGRVFFTGRQGKDVVEYRDSLFMWELSAPHKAYTRTQARFASGWYTDESYPVNYSGTNALVKATRPYYGFGDYKVTGKNSVSLVPAALKSYRDAQYASVSGGLTIDDINPHYNVIAYDVTGLDIKIPRLFDLRLEGPTYNFDGTVAKPFGLVKVASDSADWELPNYAVANLLTTMNDTLSGALNYADITWTAGGFEVAPPHRTYQFMTVDGIVMDGSAIPGTYPTLYKPYIYRYVGNANPEITWTPERVNQDGQVILRRFVNGTKDTNDITGLKDSGIYSNPQYVEVVDSKTASKYLTAVYKFIYNGKEYCLDSQGNRFVVDWSIDCATKVFDGSTYLSPYIAK